MIEFTRGDLFSHPGLQAIGHGCNAAGAMGAGIAVEFKRLWPDMYMAYRKLCLDGAYKPGDVFLWQTPGMVIFNLCTQESWRTKATLEAIERSVSAMLVMAEERKLMRVGLPRIGAGLGGLNWNEVKNSLSRVAESSPVTLVVFEIYVSGKTTLEVENENTPSQCRFEVT